jgi:two-component system nitrogen regulation sensor histidine kinase NtrY
MTRQLTHQRTELMETNRLTEERRRLFDSVLASVTAGVIGLDGEGRIDFVNRAAVRLLDLSDAATGQMLISEVPEFAALMDRQSHSPAQSVQEEIRLTRRGKLESLLVRVAGRSDGDGQAEGTVVAFDDVTQLVSAQRMAAWGDVARRIAHEIKNPLTPIQLSAERIKRKFRDQVNDPDDLIHYADVFPLCPHARTRPARSRSDGPGRRRRDAARKRPAGGSFRSRPAKGASALGGGFNHDRSGLDKLDQERRRSH